MRLSLQAQSQVYGGVTYYDTMQQQAQPKRSPPRRSSHPVTVRPPPPEVTAYYIQQGELNQVISLIMHIATIFVVCCMFYSLFSIEYLTNDYLLCLDDLK